MIVILAAFSSNVAVNNLSKTNHKIAQNTVQKIDWRFKTAIKVESLNFKKNFTFIESKQSINSKKSINFQELIQYGSEDYQYPLLVDMPNLVERIKKNQSLTVYPINDDRFKYLIENRNLCKLSNSNKSKIDIIILIKSSPENFIARDTIRSTWGKHVCWGGRIIRRLFLLGSVTKKDKNILQHINREYEVYGDIVQQDFHDHYYNNTYKMMLGLNWITTNCKNARYIMFVDDDYFVHPRMALLYLESLSSSLYSRLISGYVWRTATPQRNTRTKWFVSPTDYPWPFYPPYCSAGNFFLSMDVAIDISIAMKYTRFLRFDDVFLGIVLHKLLIVPMHLSNVYSFNPIAKSSSNYHQMISSHGYKNPKQIMDTWVDLNCSTFCQ